MFDFINLDSTHFTAFLVATLVIAIVPGPDMAYIVSRSIAEGKKAGIATSFGMQVGVMFHILLAAFGLSALLMTSALVFQIIKYIGAAYLIYLGIQTIRDKKGLKINIQDNQGGIRKAFWQGAIIDIFNPKVALFFLTFLPQFISPNMGNTFFQFIFLGVVFALLTLIVDIGYSLIAGSIKNVLAKNNTAMQWQKKISGFTLIGLGTLLAFEKRG
ncbi:LysE family translocator [Psychrobacillus sp. NEAU-3TGS]|uniref:LysE family translocator n=1 Tax=Psychrobacillus sp. NEAU-3TGS TaxID=2995412 RepID=UPI002499A1BB|nr:LysE family translocator [Psychrobacillus sp. NEAU-3TGS]MDI2587047.1 LysE family translocator [Psychrobacillus sp. NEAU-3TGS]